MANPGESTCGYWVIRCRKLIIARPSGHDFSTRPHSPLLFGVQSSLSRPGDLGELVLLGHVSVLPAPPTPHSGELPFLQGTVPQAGRSLKPTSRGSDVVQLEQSPPTWLHSAARVLSPVWEACCPGLGSCSLQARPRQQPPVDAGLSEQPLFSRVNRACRKEQG